MEFSTNNHGPLNLIKFIRIFAKRKLNRKNSLDTEYANGAHKSFCNMNSQVEKPVDRSNCQLNYRILIFQRILTGN